MSFIATFFQKAKSSYQRFPLVLTWVSLGSLFLIVLLGTDDHDLIEKYENLTYTLLLGVSWIIGVQFLSESFKHNTTSRIVYKILCIAGLGLFFYYLEFIEQEFSDVALGRWLLLLLAGHVFLIFSPFLTSWQTHKFWNYLKAITYALLRSLIYSLVLFIGLSLAIVALEFLFDADFNSYIYLQNFIFCLGIVNTFIYLSDFPKLKDLEETIDFNKAIEVLILYILIPLSLLYIVIVYAYALKILFQWELPRGWVTYLISALSILAFVIHIAIEPVRKTHPAKLINKFFPYFFYAILPLLPLLFIALWKRIADYNFTELRYLGVLLAIWIGVMLGHMLISNSKNLSYYAKLLFVFIAISTFGPLSASKISINAQLSELKTIMTDLEAKENNTFSNEEYMRFSSIVRYLDDRNALGKTEALFGFDPKEVFSKTTTYGLPKKIADTLQIDVSKASISHSKPFKSYNLRNFKANYAEEITDYTYYTELRLEPEIDAGKALQMTFDENNVISFNYYGEALFESDMTSHLKAMAVTYDFLSDASQDEFTFRFKNQNGDFLIIFSKLAYNYHDQNIEILSGEVKLFYRTFQVLELP